MGGKIAVEPNLTPVKDYLAKKGYKVEDINIGKENAKDLCGYDAVVVTGMNSDFLGMSDTETKAVVINASGMTPDDVANELERRI